MFERRGDRGDDVTNERGRTGAQPDTTPITVDNCRKKERGSDSHPKVTVVADSGDVEKVRSEKNIWCCMRDNFRLTVQTEDQCETRPTCQSKDRNTVREEELFLDRWRIQHYLGVSSGTPTKNRTSLTYPDATIRPN